MTVLLGFPAGRAEFGDDEQEALEVLAEAGLVPPLRMVPDGSSRPFEKWLRVV